MWRKRALILVIAMSMTAVAAGMGLGRHVTRTRCETGLPVHEYQHGSPSRRVTAFSRPALAITRDTPTSARQIKLFQWTRGTLAVDHCSISRMALEIHDDGAYVLTFRAEQNPRNDDQRGQKGEVARELTLTEVKQSQHLLRNQFFVVLRCYGGVSPSATKLPTVGAPVIVLLEPPPFWVERGQPRDIYVSHCVNGLKNYFDRIDRVEIELHYR